MTSSNLRDTGGQDTGASASWSGRGHDVAGTVIGAARPWGRDEDQTRDQRAAQTDYVAAAFGEDETLWRTLPSFSTPDTPLYTEQGGEPLKGERDYGLARKLLAAAGYTNDPIVLLVAADIPLHKA